MKTNPFFTRLIGSFFGLVLLAAPSLSGALIISSVDVIVGGAEYCSVGFGCANAIWNLPAGVTSGAGLQTGQTLVLTQTGLLGSQQRGGENFDTSYRGGNPALVACSTAGGTPCTVQIRINGVLVNNDNGNTDPLTARNQEPSSDTSLDTLFQEAAAWVPAPSFTGTGYTLDLGYADNIHGGVCAGVGCFPQAVWDITNESPASPGNGAATYFLGAGIGPIGNCVITTYPTGVTHPATDSSGHNVGCYDGGALRITALPTVTVPEPSSLVLFGVALAGLGRLRRRPRA